MTMQKNFSVALVGSERGFTLIEVLLSLMLMTLLSAMAYSGVSAMANASTILSRSTEKTLSMQAAFEQWIQDWDAASSLLMRPGVKFTGNAIRMVRRSTNELGQVVAWKTTLSGLERLAWPPTSNPDALRRQWDATWDWTQASKSTATFASASDVAVIDSWSMLRDMRLYYYMENTWGTPYNTDTSDGWPDAVRLEIDTPNGSVTLDWKNMDTMSTGKL